MPQSKRDKAIQIKLRLHDNRKLPSALTKDGLVTPESSRKFYADMEKRDNHQKNNLVKFSTHENKNMNMHIVKDSEIKQLGDYKVLVRTGGQSHTAFHTMDQFYDWLHERNLKIGADGMWGSKHIIGSYSDVSLSGNQEMLDKFGKENNLDAIRVMSNGKWIRGYIDKKSGTPKIYSLNPNYVSTELNRANYWK